MAYRMATFSIVAHDADERAWGIAVASKFPAVGAVVPWARADAGAIATQSYANTSYGPRGLDLLASGMNAQETLDRLLDADEDRALRQVGIIDSHGGAASFTGKDCHAWAGGTTGADFTVQGNILTGPEVVQAMAEAFESEQGKLPDKLIAALLAGDRAGGDRRGKQSAALLVVKPEGGYAGWNDRWIDYRVDDHHDPVPRLGELLGLHRLYFDKSPEGERLKIEGEVAAQLQEIMQSLGYYDGPIHSTYDSATRESLRAFIGNENFEDRTDFEGGVMDAPVFEHLLKQFLS